LRHFLYSRSLSAVLSFVKNSVAACWTTRLRWATLETRTNVSLLQSSVVVLALLVGTGCSAPTPPRYVVPNLFAEVSIVDVDVVGGVDVDLHTAVQTREAVESEFQKAYGQKGHPRWFFHAFDRENLDFVVARYEPTAGASRYVALRRLRVKRTRDAERALGVVDVVHDFELKKPKR